MRMSCNGCRVLRKGCSEDCNLRPCLQWIETPESQANATVFLAKFYGRSGLVNLINAGPDHLRPEIFRSLLYEACGRIINPIYGSVGLMWSGNWQRCQAAMEAVLEGSPIMQVSSDDDAEGHPIMPLKDCDIRHLSKNSNGIHRVRTRNSIKWSGSSGRSQVDSAMAEQVTNERTKFSVSGWDCDQDDENEQLKREPSHDSFSVETVEPTLVNRVEQGQVVKSEAPMFAEEDADLVLDLALGLNLVQRSHQSIGGGRL